MRLFSFWVKCFSIAVHSFHLFLVTNSKQFISVSRLRPNHLKKTFVGPDYSLYSRYSLYLKRIFIIWDISRLLQITISSLVNIVPGQRVAGPRQPWMYKSSLYPANSLRFESRFIFIISVVIYIKRNITTGIMVYLSKHRFSYLCRLKKWSLPYTESQVWCLIHSLYLKPLLSYISKEI